MPIAVTVFGLSLSKVLRDLGYAGLALLMLAETVFPPIPSEAVLPLAGYLVERGEFSYVLVLLTSTAGSVLGAMVLYEAARHGGRPFADRFLHFARQGPAKLLTRSSAATITRGRWRAGRSSRALTRPSLRRTPLAHRRIRCRWPLPVRRWHRLGTDHRLRGRGRDPAAARAAVAARLRGGWRAARDVRRP